MNVKVEDAGPCRKVLRVELPAERVVQEYNEVVGLFSRSAKIDGFRPGRAPVEVVKRRFSKDIEQETKDRLIPAGYHEALESKKLTPLAVLAVDHVNFSPNAPMSFSVTLDVPPEFKLPKYDGIALTGKKVEVTDQQVDDVIKSILEQNAQWNDVEGRPAGKGDLVQVDYEGVCDGRAIEELAPKATGLGKGKDFWVLTDENSFLPGFGEGLVGASKGEKRQVFVDFKADFPEKAVAGKKCAYFVDVKAIREKKLPEINAEFLKSADVDSEAAFRQRVREDLLRSGEMAEKRRLKGEIVKHLIEHTRLDVPESVVQQETRDTVYDMVRESSYRGVSEQEIESKKEELFQAASRSANDKVKIRFILHKIAEEEKIEATDEEVSGRIAEMAARYRASPQDVRAHLEKRHAIDDLKEEIRASKSLDLLLGKAKIKP